MLLKWIFVKADEVNLARINDIAFDGVERISDIPYGGVAANRYMTADLYQAEAAKGNKTPVFVNVHGGGWIYGDKDDRSTFNALLAANGFKVFGVNYGLAPEYPFPVCVQNVIRALCFIGENADKYGFDTENVFLGGDSAGGHISAIIASVFADPDLAKKLEVRLPSYKLRGIVCLSAPFNMRALIRFPFVVTLMQQVYGVKAHKFGRLRYFDEFFPSRLVRPGMPPVFISHGRFDPLCFGQGQRYIKKLKKAGVPYDQYYAKDITNCGHVYHLYHWKVESPPAVGRMIEFMDKQMGAAKRKEILRGKEGEIPKVKLISKSENRDSVKA